MKVFLQIISGVLFVAIILAGLYLKLKFWRRVKSYRIDAIVKEIKTNDCGGKHESH